jgi:isoleucyl-tRNA synthetase
MRPTYRHAIKENIMFSLLRVYCDARDSHERRSCVTALWHITNVLKDSLASVLPILAREAEEAEPLLPNSFDGCAAERLNNLRQDQTLYERFNSLKELVTTLRASVDDPSSGLALFDVHLWPISKEAKKMVSEAGATGVREFLGSATVRLVESSEVTTSHVTLTSGGYAATVEPARGKRCPRCRLLTAASDGGLCSRCHNVLRTQGGEETSSQCSTTTATAA